MAPTTALMLLVALACSGACAYNAAQALLGSGLRKRLDRRGARELLDRLGVFAERIGPLKALKAKTLDRRRRDALRSCMPEALRLLSTSLGSGSSLVQALKYAAKHSAAPLSDELQRAVWDLEAGQSFSEAMEGLRSRTGGSEFSYLAAAMEIQHVSGGSLGSAIEAVSESLQQTADLTEELRTKTTQGRLSARIVAIMPLLLLGALSLFSGNYVEMFFSSAAGVVMFVFAVLLEALGVLLVRRTLDVELAGSFGKEA